jgi:glycosyltransferase involved in cell wall biosynthesis
MTTPMVSLITISQLTRSECLKNLYELIKLQTYDNIIEWIIVEGSPNIEDAENNKMRIAELIDQHNAQYKIIYIEYTGNKLSDLRNAGNTACNGDIIVCMDDDDYYPPERVVHAVERLSKSTALIAGCSAIYMYDYFLNKLYKFNGFNSKHSTNNCMAYKKEYLLTNSHQSGLSMSEEKSFTKDFTEPMVQLVSKKSIIVSSHDCNTYNKRDLCINGVKGINPILVEITEQPITHYIPPIIFNRMKKLLI